MEGVVAAEVQAVDQGQRDCGTVDFADGNRAIEGPLGGCDSDLEFAFALGFILDGLERLGPSAAVGDNS